MVRRGENGGQKDCAQMWFGPDFRGSLKVQAMTWAEQGMYRHLLDLAWENLGLPADLEDLRGILKLSPEEFAAAWKKIGRCFAPHPDDPDRLINVRQEKERGIRASIRQKRADAAARGNEVRWGDRKGSADGSGDCESASQPDRKTDRKAVADAIATGSQNGRLSPSPPPSPSPVPLRPSAPSVREQPSFCGPPDPQDDRSADREAAGSRGTPEGGERELSHGREVGLAPSCFTKHATLASLFRALQATSYRRNSAHRDHDLGVAAASLHGAGIGAVDLATLARKAQGKGKKPAGLFAHWIDHPDEAVKELSKR